MTSIRRSKVINSLNELEGNNLNRFQKLNRTDLIFTYIEDLEKENMRLKKELENTKDELKSVSADFVCLWDHCELLHNEFDKRVKEIRYGK